MFEMEVAIDQLFLKNIDIVVWVFLDSDRHRKPIISTPQLLAKQQSDTGDLSPLSTCYVGYYDYYE